MGMDGFEAALRQSAEEVEQTLDALLPQPVGAEARVLEAIEEQRAVGEARERIVQGVAREPLGDLLRLQARLALALVLAAPAVNLGLGLRVHDQAFFPISRTITHSAAPSSMQLRWFRRSGCPK